MSESHQSDSWTLLHQDEKWNDHDDTNEKYREFAGVLLYNDSYQLKLEEEKIFPVFANKDDDDELMNYRNQKVIILGKLDKLEGKELMLYPVKIKLS